MKDNIGRRGFFKYLLALGAFGVSYFFSFKKDEGFPIAKIKGWHLGIPEAHGTCSYGSNCAGGGGQCSYGSSCGGGQGDSGGGSGGGTCSYGSNCAGGGGQCSYGSSCGGR